MACGASGFRFSAREGHWCPRSRDRNRLTSRVMGPGSDIATHPFCHCLLITELTLRSCGKQTFDFRALTYCRRIGFGRKPKGQPVHLWQVVATQMHHPQHLLRCVMMNSLFPEVNRKTSESAEDVRLSGPQAKLFSLLKSWYKGFLVPL